MKEPKFSVGQTVYVLPTVNRTTTVVDRYWEEDLKPKPGYRYKVATSSAWFPESEILTHEEIQEMLEHEKYRSWDDPDYCEEEWQYDSDSGKTYIPDRGVVEI